MPKRVTTEPGQDRGPAILAPARFGGYPGPLRRPLPGGKLVRFLATTDHKQIGLLYLLTSFGFFVLAGIEAMVIRAELAGRVCSFSPRSSTTSCSPRTGR